MDAGSEVAAEGVQLDAHSLRALAHPLRMDILTMLRTDGPATMTMLADRLGQRTGTVAWHVKQLAKHHFIQEIPDRGVGRERWWRAAERRVEIHPQSFTDDPRTALPLKIYAQGVLATGYRRAEAWLNSEWDKEWAAVATASDWTLSMDSGQLGALLDEIREVIARHAAAGEPAGPGSRRIFVQLQAFPEAERRTDGWSG